MRVLRAITASRCVGPAMDAASAVSCGCCVCGKLISRAVTRFESAAPGTEMALHMGLRRASLSREISWRQAKAGACSLI
jgi:hypothetical protein